MSSHLTSATGLLTITLCPFSLEMRFHWSECGPQQPGNASQQHGQPASKRLTKVPPSLAISSGLGPPPQPNEHRNQILRTY